jgi:hypothetical protein
MRTDEHDEAVRTCGADHDDAVALEVPRVVEAAGIPEAQGAGEPDVRPDALPLVERRQLAVDRHLEPARPRHVVDGLDLQHEASPIAGEPGRLRLDARRHRGGARKRQARDVIGGMAGRRGPERAQGGDVDQEQCRRDAQAPEGERHGRRSRGREPDRPEGGRTHPSGDADPGPEGDRQGNQRRAQRRHDDASGVGGSDRGLRAEMSLALVDRRALHREGVGDADERAQALELRATEAAHRREIVDRGKPPARVAGLEDATGEDGADARQTR